MESVRSANPVGGVEALHTNDDVDRDRLAHHHTLGWGANQAAPGAETLAKIGTGGGEPGPVGPQGPVGPTGPPGATTWNNPTWNDLSGAGGGGDTRVLGETFIQASPSAMWTINHALTFIPNVNITDSSGNQVEGDVKYMTATQVVVTFSAAFAGTAYLS